MIQHRCAPCDRYLGRTEMRTVGTGTSTILVCSRCGEPVLNEPSRVLEPLWRRLLGAFAYPFRPTSAIAGGLVAVATVVVSNFPLVGGLLAGGLLLGYLFAIVRDTAAGRDDIEISPEQIGGAGELIYPLLRYFVVLVVAFGPAVAVRLLVEGPEGDVAAAGAALVGAVYLPAGFIVTAHSGFLGALYPVPALQLIARIPGPYAVTLGFLLLAMGVEVLLAVLGHAIAGALESLPLLPALLRRCLELYAAIVMARMLGLLVNTYEEELS